MSETTILDVIELEQLLIAEENAELRSIKRGCSIKDELEQMRIKNGTIGYDRPTEWTTHLKRKYNNLSPAHNMLIRTSDRHFNLLKTISKQQLLWGAVIFIGVMVLL
jgi:hypothetical protein